MRGRDRRWVPALAVAAALVAGGCSSSGQAGAEELADRQIRITTTTNFITDTARRIAGDRAEVTGLLGPGVDPHLYRASAGDVGTLRDADVIFYGGLELEGRMADLFAELAEDRTTVAVSAAAPRDMLLSPPEFDGQVDPHIWFDPELWEYAMREVAATLGEVDPAHAADYDRRLAELVAEVDQVDAECAAMFEAIPERSRLLVTSHDAFNYFGERYGFDVEAIQGVSTATEAATADVGRIAGLLADRDVPAVFVESSVPRRTIDAVIAAAGEEGQRVRVGGELFSDAAGDEGTDEGTYPGMLRHNCTVIAEGLG